MKKLIIVSVIILTVVLGYWLIRARVDRTSNKPTTFSSDGYTWQVGAVIMDGTNVPASQVNVRAIHSTNIPPQTNAVSK